MGETKAGLDEMTGKDGMMEWDKVKREPAVMEKQAETLMGMAKMVNQGETMTRLAEMRVLVL